MGILRRKNSKNKPKETDSNQSIYYQKEKIDRHGNAWEKKPFWYRKEYLNKLEVIAHLKQTSLDELIDKSIGEYVAKNWDKSEALKKTVEKSMDKKQPV